MTVPQKIRRRREQLGLTRAQLADRIRRHNPDLQSDHTKWIEDLEDGSEEAMPTFRGPLCNALSASKDLLRDDRSFSFCVKDKWDAARKIENLLECLLDLTTEEEAKTIVDTALCFAYERRHASKLENGWQAANELPEVPF